MSATLGILIGVAVFLGAIVAAFVAGSAVLRSNRGGDYLCDSCKYNDARYCTQPDRPNATVCPEYKSR